MRSSVVARASSTKPFRSKFISSFLAVVLAVGLLPVQAFAAAESLTPIPGGSEGAVRTASSAEEESRGVLALPLDDSSTADAGGAASTSEDVSHKDDAEGPVSDPAEDEAAADDAGDTGDTGDTARPSEVVNQEVPLSTVVAQAESSRSFFLAQTLESTRTVPMVSAKLPLGGEEIEDVVGSFEQNGMTFAIEPDAGSVALVAVDYAKLPEKFVVKQVIAIPDTVSPDGTASYRVARIADEAFSSLKKEGVNSDYVGARELFSDGELLAEVGIDPSEVEKRLTSETVAVALDDDSVYDFVNPFVGCTGILAISIPASISYIGEKAFSGSDTLQYLVVSDDNAEYASFDGVLYNADVSELLLVPKGRVGAVRIAASVNEFKSDALAHCPSVDALVVDADGADFSSLDDSPTILVLSSTKNGDEVDDVLLYREETLNALMDVDSRAVYAAGPYYESVYTFVACTSVEAQYTNGHLDAVMNHTGPANGYAYGRFAGEEIVVMGPAGGQWMLLRRINGENITDLNYSAWASTERGKYIKHQLYWDAALTNPIPSGTYHQNVDAYLGWGYTSYNIELNANGGSGSRPPIEGCNITQVITMPDAWSCPIKRTGYLLTAWRIGGADFASGVNANVNDLVAAAGCSANQTSDTFTAYAQWTPQSYRISFDSNTGSGGQVGNVMATFDANMPVISNERPVKAGYAFGGWWDTAASSGGTQYYTADGVSARTWDKASDATLYARWIPVTYVVAYDDAGGTFAGKIDSYTIETTDFTLPVTGIRTGYTFAGWEVTGASGAGVIGNGTANVTVKQGTYGNLTAKAKWNINTYHLSWSVLHGTHSNRIADFTVNDCPIAMTAATPSAGYTFIGWSGTGITVDSKSFVLSSSMLEGKGDGETFSYIASFSANSYVVRLHANDGTGADGFGVTVEDVVTYDSAVTAVVIPKRYGYVFSGYWTKKSDGARDELYFDKNGLYVKASVWKDVINIDLYACWTLMASLEVPINAPAAVTLAVDKATVIESDGAGALTGEKVEGRLRSAVPQEVPVACIELESLRDADGTLAATRILGEGNPAKCGVEVSIGSSADALLRLDDSSEGRVWEPISPLAIPAATPIAVGSVGDDVTTDSLGNFAKMGELELTYAMKLLPGFDVYKMPVDHVTNETVARIVFTVDLTGLVHERF